MAAKIEEAGGRIHLSTPVQEVVVADGRAVGLRVDGDVVACDRIVSTVQTPLLSRLLPEADAAYRARLSDQQYLGIICPLMVLERPLTGYWTINITDESVPFTGIIETTAYIDPRYVGGHHLVYLPKYTMPQSEWQHYSDAEIKEIWLSHLQRMFPDFDRTTVRYFVVNRSRYVEPLHGLGGGERILDIDSPVGGLYLATTAQIYPDLTNGESVSRHAARVAQVVADNAVSRPAGPDSVRADRETAIETATAV